MARDIPAILNGERADALTAYPDDEARLCHRLASGRIDVGSFRRPVARCAISTCRGMCCYDGVYISQESAAVIERMARERAAFFDGLGLRLPEGVIVEGAWRWKMGGVKTAVVPRAFSATVEGFPAHFTDTACVFLTGEGHCALQLLSIHEGRHPWYYKPVKCWMHPITLEGEAPSILRLHDEHTDPYRFPGYDGFVSQIFCGRTRPGGASAAAVLADELVFLSRIAGRDLVAEILPAAAPLRTPAGPAQT